jgi:hypothetical protein
MMLSWSLACLSCREEKAVFPNLGSAPFGERSRQIVLKKMHHLSVKDACRAIDLDG